MDTKEIHKRMVQIEIQLKSCQDEKTRELLKKEKEQLREQLLELNMQKKLASQKEEER